MITKQEVIDKAEKLRNSLSKRKVCENFGNKEQHQLMDFIGDIYQYPAKHRCVILEVYIDFCEWCQDFEGK